MTWPQQIGEIKKRSPYLQISFKFSETGADVFGTRQFVGKRHPFDKFLVTRVIILQPVQFKIIAIKHRLNKQPNK